MKKLKFLLVFLISIFLFNTNVKADGPSITCPSSITVGNPFTCSIKTDIKVNVISDLKVYKGSSSMTADGTITFKANEEGSFDISLIDDSYTNTYETITIVAKKEITTTSKTTTTTKSTTTTTTTTTIKKSNNNYVNSIKIEGKEIEGFDKEKNKYQVNVESSVLYPKFIIKLEDEKAKYEIDGPKSMSFGENEYIIKVTAEDESIKNYKVIINRLNEISSNTKISNIIIKGYNINFDGNSKTYHLTLKNDEPKLNIKVSLEDEKASYEIEGNDNLKDGSEIKIKVTAEDGKTSNYRIIISKEEKKNIIPFIIIGIALLIIIIIVIILIIKNKKKKENQKDLKDKNEDITKKIVTSEDEEDSFETQLDETAKIDNDLEKTKILELDSEIDKMLQSTFDDNEN